MRTLGPGSISSFLKIILDVIYYALWVGVIFLGALALLAILLSFNPEFLKGALHLTGEDGAEFEANGATIAAGLSAAGLYTTGVLVILGRLRRIFATLTAGDPFHPDNVRRLRVVGLVLAALEIGRYVFWAASAVFLPGVDRMDQGFSLTAWFSVLVVFVLAEVFREGARLRSEAELTI
ncbi:MAG TPA: DUF2975 domain-containing protein [Caulobacteraceae bacterium]